MLTSRSNLALADIRVDATYLETGSIGAVLSVLDFLEEGVGAARVTLDYLEYSFGSAALNDGLYTPEEIDHARRVLTKFLAVYA